MRARVTSTDPAPLEVLLDASVLAVVAHPDDESFGLGAVLAHLSSAGSEVSLLCFTHGEASTLASDELERSALHAVRAEELAAAAGVLGLASVELRDYPDGRLSSVPLEELAAVVEAESTRRGSGLLLVFDEHGITGHPDHVQATRAALTAAERLDLPVVAWAVDQAVAETLNAEFGTGFVGRPASGIDTRIAVDRNLQNAAICCHRSQSTANPVLWRRLALTGGEEPLRVLRASRREATRERG